MKSNIRTISYSIEFLFWFQSTDRMWFAVHASANFTPIMTCMQTCARGGNFAALDQGEAGSGDHIKSRADVLVTFERNLEAGVYMYGCRAPIHLMEFLVTAASLLQIPPPCCNFRLHVGNPASLTHPYPCHAWYCNGRCGNDVIWMAGKRGMIGRYEN